MHNQISPAIFNLRGRSVFLSFYYVIIFPFSNSNLLGRILRILEARNQFWMYSTNVPDSFTNAGRQKGYQKGQLSASKIAFFFVAIVSMLTYVLLALLRDRSAALILPTLALTIGWLVWYVAAATAKYPVWCYQDYMINAGLSVVLLAITTTKIFSNPRLASLNTAAKSKQIAKLMASTTALAAMTSAMFFVIFSGISVQISINRDLLADRLGIARGKFIVEKEKKSEPLVEIKSPKASIDVDIVVVDEPTDIKAINDDTLAVRDIEAQVRAAQKSDLMTSTSDTKGKTK